MQAYKPHAGLDLNDGIALRVFFESMRGWLESERASQVPTWEQQARYLVPRHQRINYEEVNNGRRRDTYIVDNCGTMAVRTATAGLFSGTCAPTRTWFNYKVTKAGDRKINERRNVKMYTEEVSNIVRAALLKSNWYQNAYTAYRDELIFGTAAYMIQEDPVSDFRCYGWPVGSYYLASDHTARVAFFMRVMQKTVVQLVDEFGKDNCSQQIRTLYDSPQASGKEQWFPTVQIICKNSYFGEAYAAECKRRGKGEWSSFWYEMGPYKTDAKPSENGMLRRGFFEECPVMAPRWDVIGEDVYGVGPGHEAIGDVMGLQATSMMITKGVDKQVDPPMIAHPTLANGKISVLPGDTTFADTRDGHIGFRPAYQVQFNLEHGMRRESEIRARINEAFYKNVFLMHADSDRRNITAEEIRARDEEKMTVLGPVLGRNNTENLQPALMRIANILNRRGKLPPPPEELRDAKFDIEFDSLLSQAQKMLGMANIERFMAGVGSEAAVNQGVFDTVDLDEVCRTSADLLSVPARLLRDRDEVAKIRASKDAALQRQSQAENAQKMASAAKNLSDTRTDQPSALADLIHSNTGAGP